jgi:predicted RNA-binding Zn ribbon-like protein
MADGLPPAMFIAGVTGIDFLNSVAVPVDVVVEWIGNGADLLDWLKQARLLTASDVSIIKSNFSAGELDQIALRARELREWFRGFVVAHRGKALSPRTLNKLEPLNKLLGRDQVFWSIAPKTQPDQDVNEGSLPHIFRLRPQRRWRTPESVLAPIAEELAKVVCHVDFRHIKACEGKKCTLVFYDETSRHERRWCSMAICGNRAKQQAFRQRSHRP